MANRKEKDKDKSHTRAPGMTQISISLPQKLVDKVDRLAGTENRSRSNYIAYILSKIPEEEQIPFIQASESKKAFNS